LAVNVRKHEGSGDALRVECDLCEFFCRDFIMLVEFSPMGLSQGRSVRNKRRTKYPTMLEGKGKRLLEDQFCGNLEAQGNRK
jgi:hypothetical protein